MLKRRASIVINLDRKPKRLPCLILDSSKEGFRLRGSRLTPPLPQQHFGLRLVVSKPVSKLADSCDNVILFIGWTRCLGKFAAGRFAIRIKLARGKPAN